MSLGHDYLEVTTQAAIEIAFASNNPKNADQAVSDVS